MEPKAAKQPWELAQEREAVEAAESVSRFTNRMGFSGELFVSAMSKQHRTLQQSFTRICLMWLVHLAELPEGWYDLRNEASVKIAKKLMGGEDTKYIHCLPHI